MPSEKVLLEKQTIVNELTEKLKSAAAGVFVDYKGITVANDTKLRADLRKAGVDYSVVKNTLTRFAIKNVGMDELDSILNGTTALAISTTDPISPAKILNEFAKKNDKFVIKGGFMDGKVMSVNEVKALADIPSKETLLTRVVCGFNAPIIGLALTIKAIAEKSEA